jgi:phosphatidate cytidylyltransferase
MYTQRMLTVIVLVPILVLIIMLGGWALTLTVTALMAIGGWEFWRLFKNGGHCPSLVLLAGGTAALLLAYGFFGFRGSQLVLAGLVLLAMGWFVISFERGSCSQPGSDFVITLGGVVYLGWLAIFVIALRQLPNGQWWMLTALPPIWLADGGAYLIGRKIGKHKMAPRTSPGKSWEGYFAGVLFGALGTMGLAFLWGMRAPEITPLIGLLIGTVISILAPLGDLGESMLKRQFGVKDSGVLFPGHGGVLDRADSTLWAAAIGYLLILLVR